VGPPPLAGHTWKKGIDLSKPLVKVRSYHYGGVADKVCTRHADGCAVG
jgi:hypothetical protein